LPERVRLSIPSVVTIEVKLDCTVSTLLSKAKVELAYVPKVSEIVLLAVIVVALVATLSCTVLRFVLAVAAKA